MKYVNSTVIHIYVIKAIDFLSITHIYVTKECFIYNIDTDIGK